MFFFAELPWYNILMWFVVLGCLIGLNELVVRTGKWGSLVFFIAIPIALTPIWLNMDSEITSWFTWVKVYSALAGCIIYMVIRFTDFHKKHPKFLLLVPGILALNILEAAVRELQVGIAGFNGLVDGMYYISGSWNYFNAAAGIINILLISGWFGIYATKGKRIDMVWPDMTMMYIVAYAVWNISYVYSCAPGNSFYSGFALNIAPIIPALFWAKGTWMQNRAHTLSFWMLWVMTFPYFFATGSTFNVPLSYNPTANWSLAIASFALNLGLLMLQMARIKKLGLNPLKDEIWNESKNKARNRRKIS